ncbi:MAG: hypothetical protein IMY70_06965, partial [Bacteroidetes bacterium]|nr:hypothetical protein [Bacteroidota bacterium]
MKINPVRAYSIEEILFFLFGIISVLHFFFLKFVPSLDGPQHLYTSSVIVELVKSNDTIKEFFTFNDLIVGNWVGHFLLSLFNFFLSAQFAEKIFLVVYVFGIAYAFRYLIKSILGYVPYHAVIIYPFAFTVLFLQGYYNYSFAFIFLFVSLGFWVRIKDHLNLKNGIIFLLLQLLLFLSHIFVFVLYGYI